MSLNVALLRQSFELACPAGAAQQQFAEQFYHTLFARYPQVRPLFACTDMQEQARKLMATRALVLNGLTKPDVLLPALQRLGQRHARVGVQDAHYPMVAEAQRATCAARLGSRWTSELQAAWTAAYETIAAHMLGTVEGERESTPHGPC
jgi:hemoglobin-like flavoprotein